MKNSFLLAILIAFACNGLYAQTESQVNSTCEQLYNQLIANKASNCKHGGVWITYPEGMGEIYNDGLGHSFFLDYEPLSDTSVSIITAYCAIGTGKHMMFVEDEESLETVKFLLRVANGGKLIGEKCSWDPNYGCNLFFLSEKVSYHIKIHIRLHFAVFFFDFHILFLYS